ncbi:MAG: 16S rRNA (cytosine(967)-C(5))-methyltransferase RsmB [Clostridia bacterium]|nr:16S rRNA (cytosine(967)-C(5))-methyltransferase RsmB [Clostridia bacterium]
MNARQAAFRILFSVTERHEYLHLALKKYHFDEPQKQRFVTALVSAVLENYYKINYVLGRFIKPDRTDPELLTVLRIGAAQILEMNGVADHAAVNESVKLAAAIQPRARNFVNAVLRNVVRTKDDVRYPDARADFTRYLHVRYSYPLWICRYFLRQYGPDLTEKLLSYHRSHDLTGIRLVHPPQGPVPYEPGIYLDDAAYIRGAERLDRMPAFKNGEITAQSESSMMCVRAAGIRPGDRVLDLCAAPGGKTAYAAQLAFPGQVTACDLHEHRVSLIEETAARLGLSNVRTLCTDAGAPHPEWQEVFDVVLVDAPCSALGLLYRKPDLKIFKKQKDLEELAEIQRRILKSAAGCVAPGGVLIYSTCTMDDMENQENALWFARTHPEFSQSSLADLLPGRIGERGIPGWVQLLPPIDNVDGFFIARFVKHADTAGKKSAGT